MAQKAARGITVAREAARKPTLGLKAVGKSTTPNSLGQQVENLRRTARANEQSYQGALREASNFSKRFDPVQTRVQIPTRQAERSTNLELLAPAGQARAFHEQLNRLHRNNKLLRRIRGDQRLRGDVHPEALGMAKQLSP